MSLKEYERKRDFHKTKEPRHGKRARKTGRKEPMFVVQKHWASHLHYDFRLEAFGVLKSWAVPKGPSLDPHQKRLAVEVEDHPISYGHFEGHIPKGEYGGGEVIVWDQGTWDRPENLKKEFEKGHLEFELHGEKLKGKWLLQRTRKNESGKNQWLLIKRTDEEARPEDEYNVIEERPQSVLKNKRVKKKSLRKVVKRPQAEVPRATQLKGNEFHKIKPKLAVLVEDVPQGKNWIYELKYDGYRTFAICKKKSVHLLTRSSLDWTNKYGPLPEDLTKLKAKQAVLDGEIVCLDEKGHSSFSLLQAALKDKDYSRMVYYAFDLLALNGNDLRNLPLEERKTLLKDLLHKSKLKKVIYSDHWCEDGRSLFAATCSEELEGIVAKDRTAVYSEGRNPDWLKIKCSRRQEFVIGGYTDPQGARSDFGALLMGTYDEDGKLNYRGKIGTGFNQKNLASTLQALQKLDQEDSSFSVGSPRGRGIHWVKPQLVAEIEFKSFTGDGMIRQGSFQGLRQDKRSQEVHLETPKKLKKTAKAAVKPDTIEGIKITHADRLVYPDYKITKMDVIKYYQSVEKWILPHLRHRPLSLLRCVGGQESCFFQKHLETMKVDGVEEFNFTYKKKKENVIFVDNIKGVLGLAQWGTLEFHVWGSTAPQVLKPNLVVFDLDPDQGLPWKKVKDAAYQIRENLKALGLESYLKVTGGKGLHIHVPCRASYTWDEIKNFAHTFVREMEDRRPDLYTTNTIKKQREGKIFLDYLRNGFGATSVAPYGLRAHEAPSVALPLRWEELRSLKKPNSFLINNVVALLKKRKKDPWVGYFDNHQKIKILESH